MNPVISCSLGESMNLLDDNPQQQNLSFVLFLEEVVRGAMDSCLVKKGECEVRWKKVYGHLWKPNIPYS